MAMAVWKPGRRRDVGRGAAATDVRSPHFHDGPMFERAALDLEEDQTTAEYLTATNAVIFGLACPLTQGPRPLR